MGCIYVNRDNKTAGQQVSHNLALSEPPLRDTKMVGQQVKHFLNLSDILPCQAMQGFHCSL